MTFALLVTGSIGGTHAVPVLVVPQGNDKKTAMISLTRRSSDDRSTGSAAIFAPIRR